MSIDVQEKGGEGSVHKYLWLVYPEIDVQEKGGEGPVHKYLWLVYQEIFC
jgi:hypothetical protein